MTSESLLGAIVGAVGSIFGGKKASKQAAANSSAINQLAAKVNLLTEENVKQSKTITYLLVGLAVVGMIVLFIVIRKRR